MSGRHSSKLHPPGAEKGITTEEKGARSLARNGFKCRIYFAAGAGIEDLNLHAHRTSSGFNVAHRGLRSRCIGRIDEHSNTRKCRHEFTQEFQSFRGQLTTKKIDARCVPGWPGEARDKAKLNRVFAYNKDEWNRRGCRLSCESRGITPCDDHRNLSAD